MPFDERAFRKAMGCFATGVTVVTSVDAEGLPVGVTVNSFTSVSLDPPLVLFCLHKQSSAVPAFSEGRFAVNVLREDQKEVSIAFASREGKNWNGIASRPGLGGVPLLDHCIAHLECSVHTVSDGGDHVIVIGRVENLEMQAGGQPLLYYRGAYATLHDGA
ncbi:flavin reductase family protein [Novispirillum itersonii]|uniref:flavin reductase family protein n=1 Tax=Novispirillum itersonii TaxID=189 RepID=UPI00037EA104|nr:flavin reductase family protein [Novispirillum itersonii]